MRDHSPRKSMLKVAHNSEQESDSGALPIALRLNPMITRSSRVAEVQWSRAIEALSETGFSRLGVLLSPNECREIRDLYSEPERFRSRIDMARYRFGRGEYQYFRYPLPEIVSHLRTKLYPYLAPVANTWMAALGSANRFPDDLDAFMEQCRANGQTRPTPLLLRYGAADFNCLHQDIYGDLVFPFQVIIGLSDPAEYVGGELLLVEQKPRSQSRGHVIVLCQGEAVVITTRFRPIKSSRGYYRAIVRHGVSTITSGERYTLGIVFHDSK